MRKTLNAKWDHFAPTLLSYKNFPNKTALSQEVKRYYLNNAPVSQSNAKEAANMVSDRNFFLDNHDAAIMQSRVAPVYTYYYTYQGLFALGNLLFSRTALPLPGNLDYLVGTGLNWVTSNLLRRRRKSKLGKAFSMRKTCQHNKYELLNLNFNFIRFICYFYRNMSQVLKSHTFTFYNIHFC